MLYVIKYKKGFYANFSGGPEWVAYAQDAAKFTDPSHAQQIVNSLHKQCVEGEGCKIIELTQHNFLDDDDRDEQVRQICETLECFLERYDNLSAEASCLYDRLINLRQSDYKISAKSILF